MALHSPPRQAGRTNVAAWVGTMAHALIAEEPIPDQEYGRIAYDQLTPTEHVAQVQAQSIARHARKLLVDKGWGILGQEEALGRPPELTGHLDLRGVAQRSRGVDHRPENGSADRGGVVAGRRVSTPLPATLCF